MNDAPKPWYHPQKVLEIFPSLFARHSQQNSRIEILASRGPDAESQEARCAQCGARYPDIGKLKECAECGSDNLLGVNVRGQ
jgi:hypothetical protein